jgi:hypothetical protein
MSCHKPCVKWDAGDSIEGTGRKDLIWIESEEGKTLTGKNK